MSGRSEFRATQAALHQGVASGRPGEEVLEPGTRGKEAARRAIPGISRPLAKKYGVRLSEAPQLQPGFVSADFFGFPNGQTGNL